MNLRIFLSNLFGTRWKTPPSTAALKRVYAFSASQKVVTFRVRRWRRRPLFGGVQLQVVNYRPEWKAPPVSALWVDQAIAMILEFDRRAG